MENYNYKGFCTARMPDYKKCIHFEEHEVGRGICKHLLLGGACNWEPDIIDKIADIFDGISKYKRRGYGRTIQRRHKKNETSL